MDAMTALFRGAFQPPGPGEMTPRMWGWEYHMGWIPILLIGLFWIGVIVAILFFIRWLIASTSRRHREARPTDSALEIVRQRYAKGEISKEEFEEKKKDLGFK